MDARRDWQWRYTSVQQGVTLGDGVLRWWDTPIRDGRLMPSKTSSREQSCADFVACGPLSDANTRYVRAHPEYSPDTHNPWADEPDIPRDGPFLGDIPEQVIEQLCQHLHCEEAPWRAGQVLRPQEPPKRLAPSLGERLEKLWPQAPLLRRRLEAPPKLAKKMLRIEDSSVVSALGHQSSMLDRLVKTDEDAGALVELLAGMAGNSEVDPTEALAALPRLGEIIGASTAAESLRFLASLITQGGHLSGIDSEEWLGAFEANYRTLVANGLDARKWIVQLSDYRELFPYASRWLTGEQAASQIVQAFEAIYGADYGYSDRAADLRRYIPDVFRICAPVVKDLGDFLRLCTAVPDVLRALPERSEETIVGYEHWYEADGLEACAVRAQDLRELLGVYHTDA